MKKTTLFKKIVATVGALCFCATLAVAAPVTSIKAQAAVKPSVDTNQDAISWVYQEAFGKLYKCKYNYTSGEYIGNWIYVRDL